MIPRLPNLLNVVSRLALVSVPLVGVCVLTPVTGLAQEALQHAVAGDQTLQQRRQQGIASPMPMQWGPVGFTAGVGVRMEYNDNVLFLEHDPEDDFIITPTADLAMYWPITQRLNFNLGVGIGYNFYLNETRPDVLEISPRSASEVAFDFEMGRALLTLYDRFSFSHDLSDRADVNSQTRTYGAFDNLVGTRVLWVPEPMLVEGGYGWRKILVTEELFEELNRSAHEVFFRVGHIVAEQTRWGVETSGSVTTYDEPIRNDFSQYSAGPYIEWQTTQSISLSVRGGWSWTMFDTTGEVSPSDDLSVPYASMTARHQLTAAFSHTLNFVRGVIVGIDSEYVEGYRVNYDITWELSDLVSLSGGAYYDVGTQPRIPIDEDFDRIGFGVGAHFGLTDQLDFELTYQFVHRESNISTSSSNYDVNRVIAALHYSF